MEIPLNIHRGERQQAFLDYLNAALRERTGAYSGSAGVAEDGSFNVSTSGPFQVGQATVLLTWCLTKNPDGQLTKLGNRIRRRGNVRYQLGARGL